MKSLTVALILAVPVVVVGLFFGDQASAAPLPACQFEDGSPNGQPCIWTDPDTGRQFYVDSEGYR